VKLKDHKKIFIAALFTVFVGLLLGAHFLYRNTTAEDLYYWHLYPADQATGVYPGTFYIRFNKPVLLNEEPSNVRLLSVQGHVSTVIENRALYTNEDTFFFNITDTVGGEIYIGGTTYRVSIDGNNIYDGDSASYYGASGAYWGAGFPEFCEGCANNWRVTFANPFQYRTLYATPTPNTTLDFADFATTVRTSYSGVSLGSGNGQTNVFLNNCAGQPLGVFNPDSPTSIQGNEARFEISSSTLASIIGTYDASVSGASRRVCLQLPAGYHVSQGIGAQATFFEYNLRYLAHERMTANGSIVQPNQLFSVDFNQQIALSATTTVARLYDITAGTYVASIPMTTSANAYVGNGVVSDGMTNDTLYLDFASVYALQATKSYRIEIPGIAVRKLGSWDYVRYNIDASDYTFTVAYDDDVPQVLSVSPSGTSVATSTADIVLTYDEPVTLSSGTATFEIWTNTTATTTVSSVSNAYEAVSGDEYTIDLQGIITAAFSTTTLSENTTYWIRVSANAVIDDETNAMDAPYILTFKTVATPVVEDNATSRGPSGRRSNLSAGESSVGSQNQQGQQGQPGIVPVSSLGQLSDPVDEDLSFGDVGDAVYRLQKALNKLGFYVAEEGPGSPGQETGVFATSTRAAVVRFQINAGIVPAVGFFGPITRALLGFVLNW
jgi:hypothetical protein